MHAVFNTVGKRNPHDLFEKSVVPSKYVRKAIPHSIPLLEAVDRHGHGGKHAGEQRRPGHARRPHIQDEHPYAVADHVDDIGDDGDVHGHIGFLNAAAQRRARVIDGEERQRQRRDPKIGFTGRHHIRFDLTEQKL